ncbi:hypothetical protein QBC34DRAFT_420153 [Podospora aff. communis PSN243]|uniref:Uncharacterized protein n=1 Tax=Podospora aff. communis PSN243 TaxID=3040156 RepID=A0AAV9H6I5_9PEZI|nr:hypothetical protein QBC34DRAFT_420153 [Podospora aff. communis PSN243]
MLAKTSLLAFLAGSAAAKVAWRIEVSEGENGVLGSPCVFFEVRDDAVGGMPVMISDRLCNGRDHNNDKQWTFDYAGHRNWYSATIHQNNFYYRHGYGVTYRTDHGTFYFSTGDLRGIGNGVFVGNGEAL